MLGGDVRGGEDLRADELAHGTVSMARPVRTVPELHHVAVSVVVHGSFPRGPAVHADLEGLVREVVQDAVVVVSHVSVPLVDGRWSPGWDGPSRRPRRQGFPARRLCIPSGRRV